MSQKYYKQKNEISQIRTNTTQIDLSRVYQRQIERSLAGFAILYPVLALREFRKIENIMLDDLALGWLNYLANREHDLIAVDDDESRVYLCCKLTQEFDDGQHFTELIFYMNRISADYEPVAIGRGELIWSGFSTDYIAENLASRIREQHVLRSGLQDLTLFASGYLEGVYVG